MEFDDFRIEITPSNNPGAQNQWDIRVVQSPNEAFNGDEDLNQPVSFTRQMLNDLRSPHGHPKGTLVRDTGQAVWGTLMGPRVRAAFLTAVRTRGQRGLRMVIVLKGAGTNGEIDPLELPVEAMHADALQFLAHDNGMPLVRSFSSTGEYVPSPLTPPMRVLLVSACPNDLPQANITEEIQVVQTALANLVQIGKATVETCEGATVESVERALTRTPFDIIHFVCHGSRSTGAEAYLCLQNPDDGSSHPVDAATLTAFLRNCPVRLIVLSACSSAALPPGAALPEPYPTSAFAGVAQALINANTQLGAVIAMQFDFETRAAVAFSKAFYSFLAENGGSLEQAVCAGRRSVIGVIPGGVSHRAWVTPVIYSRCKRGHLLDLSQLRDAESLSTEEEQRLNLANGTAAAYEEFLSKLCVSHVSQALPGFVQNLQTLEANRAEASALMKSAARLVHCSALPQSIADVKLKLRVGNVRLSGVRLALRFDAERLKLMRVLASCNALAVAESDQPMVVAKGVAKILLELLEKPQLVPAGEYEVGTLYFNIASDAPLGRYQLDLLACRIDTGQGWKSIGPMGAAIFVTQS